MTLSERLFTSSDTLATPMEMFSTPFNTLAVSSVSRFSESATGPVTSSVTGTRVVRSL